MVRKADPIGEPIRGFQGWRYRWWEREDERPFPEWQVPGSGDGGGGRGPYRVIKSRTPSRAETAPPGLGNGGVAPPTPYYAEDGLTLHVGLDQSCLSPAPGPSKERCCDRQISAAPVDGSLREARGLITNRVGHEYLPPLWG
jgi:hypothetical protein